MEARPSQGTVTQNMKTTGRKVVTTNTYFQEHDPAWTGRVRHEGASVCRA